MLKRILFWPYQVYVWLILIPLAMVVTFVAGWLTVLFAWLVGPRFASKHFARRWARILAWLTPMLVTVEGAHNANPNRSYVVVANHVSQYDILALYGWLKLDLKWVIKKELRKVPAVGIGCEKAGHIFIDRQNPALAKQQVNKALDELGSGVGILFFAEGTRSLDGRMLPFKKGAFRIAQAGRLPILPVTLLGTGDILPSKTRGIFPGRVKIIIHTPIEPLDESADSLRDLMNITRETIASGLPRELQD